MIVGGVAIIALSIAATLWFSGAMQQGASLEQGYENVTFTDAQMTCNETVRNQYGASLLRLEPDNHSSRYEHSAHQYKIFYKAIVSSGKGASNPAEFYVSCLVNASRGGIDEFDAAEQKEISSGAQRKSEGGVFGWPIN